MSAGREIRVIPLTLQPEKAVPSPPKNPILERGAFASAPTSAFESNAKASKPNSELSEIGSKARSAKTKVLSKAYSRAIVPKSIILKNANDNSNWTDQFMKNNAKARKETGESEVKLLENSLSPEEITDENEKSGYEFTENTVVEVRKFKRLPNANRVVKLGAVPY